jgi:superfamily II DNA helicase RecQ
MQLKLFVVPIKNASEAEAEMNGFLRGHRVLAVKKEFVPDGENSFWTFCVEYLDGTAAATGGAAFGQKVPKVDYKEVLKPEEFEVFSRLREWRKTVAEKEGVPVYAVLTNGQLAQMVQKKITTKAGL